MSDKVKVVTVVGTRPEVIRLSRLIPKLDQYTNHVLVHTGQNHDDKLNQVFFRDLEIRNPDYSLDVDTSSLGTVLAETIKKTEAVLLKEMPDALMILGDTNSAVAAIVAERLKIPVYHMEAGNRSFDSNVPEELNRRMIDHVASFNFPYTEHARANLLREGLHPRFIFKSGSPLPEIFNHFRLKIEASSILEQLSLQKGSYFLASLHRQENVDNRQKLTNILDALTVLSNEHGIPVVVSTHPRTRKRMYEFGLNERAPLLFCDPFGYLDYNKLQLSARLVLSDSGSVAEESAAMNFPAVSLRDSIERPEAIEAGITLLAGTHVQDVLANVGFILSNWKYTPPQADYLITDFSSRVMSALLSTVKKHHLWLNIEK